MVEQPTTPKVPRLGEEEGKPEQSMKVNDNPG